MCARAATRVLVVEDDGTVRGFLSRALESGGYVPVPVRTGEEALASLRAGRFAVALIDGLLPDMHGIQLARKLLDSPASAGVGALAKPVRLAELLQYVDSLMEWRAAGGSAAKPRHEAIDRLEHDLLVGR
jgi:PleD family two-component response regulator